MAGGAIKARRIQTIEELQGLLLERRKSADAAAKSLELVQDVYARGAASIVDLLDAQNAALTAEFAAVTSVYDFLNDWAEVRLYPSNWIAPLGLALLHAGSDEPEKTRQLLDEAFRLGGEAARSEAANYTVLKDYL